MANDPYWNNTALLLHGDITGDPNWESATVMSPTQAHPEGLASVSGTVTDATGALCSRVVHAHSRATGRLLGTAISDPVTGVYSIGAPEQCYVVVLDSTGDYDALILDRLDPVT